MDSKRNCSPKFGTLESDDVGFYVPSTTSAAPVLRPYCSGVSSYRPPLAHQTQPTGCLDYCNSVVGRVPTQWDSCARDMRTTKISTTNESVYIDSGIGLCASNVDQDMDFSFRYSTDVNGHLGSDTTTCPSRHTDHVTAVRQHQRNADSFDRSEHCIADEEDGVLKQEVDLFEQDDDGDTQLHLAMIMDHGSNAVVDYLIHAATSTKSLDKQNFLCQTALHLAVIMDKPEAVQTLVTAGASLNLRDHNGDSPFHLACKLNRGQCLASLVESWYKQGISASSSGNLDSKKISDVSRFLHLQNYEGETCCHFAVASRNLEILYYLLYECHANINIQEGKRGRTILHIAVEMNDITLVSTILQHPKIDVNQTTFDGKTPLDFAISCQSWSKIQLALSEAGGVATESNSDSDTESDDDLMDSFDFNDLQICGQRLV